MIITKEEYYDMGFTADNDSKLESALKRADFIINALTACKAPIALQAGGKAADCIKQAAAFQAGLILREEAGSSERKESYSLGDFSYSHSESTEDSSSEALETSDVIIRLLKASGCLFGGLETTV